MACAEYSVVDTVSKISPSAEYRCQNDAPCSRRGTDAGSRRIAPPRRHKCSSRCLLKYGAHKDPPVYLRRLCSCAARGLVLRAALQHCGCHR